MKRSGTASIVFTTALFAASFSLLFSDATDSKASAVAGSACAPAPLSGCNGISGNKSSALLDIKAAHDGNDFVAGKGKLSLKVQGLIDASLEALGAPGGSDTTDATMTDDLQACIYDDGVVAFDLLIEAGAPAWTCSGADKCSFRGTEPSGLVSVELKADTKPEDDQERSELRVSVVSREAPGGLSVIEGQNPWGAGTDPDVFDGVQGDIIVQLVNRSSGACWSFNVGGNGAGVDSSKTRNSGVSSGKPRLRAQVKIVPGLCANPSDPQCLQCPSVSYRDGATCVPCIDVSHCAVQETCTSAGDSECTSCNSGYWRNDLGEPDLCQPCTPLSNCHVATCTNASDSTCAQCDIGYYRAGGICHPCTNVDQCSVLETCTSAADSQCPTCEGGHWRNTTGTADTCDACTPIANCDLHTCTNASDSSCAQCAPDYHPSGSICEPD